MKFNVILQNLKWYFLNFPLGCLIYLFLLAMFFYSKQSLQFSDEAVCLQPHFVMTGQISRIVKYAVFHHGYIELVLSVLMVCVIGTMAERQLGTVRYCYTCVLVTILTGLIITVISIIMAFTSQFSSLPYDCPGLGSSAPMLAIFVITCRTLAIKRVMMFTLMINKNLLPWILLVIIQLSFPGTKLFSNICGCIAGNLYLLWFFNSSCIPSNAMNKMDEFLSKTFAYVPFLKYVRSFTTQLLPVTTQDCSVPTSTHQLKLNNGEVPEYKISKLNQMGFSHENSKIALTAAHGNVNEAVGLLTEAQESSDAVKIALS